MPIKIPMVVNHRNEKNEEDIINTFFFILQNVPFTQLTLRKFCWDLGFCGDCVYFSEGECERCGKVTKKLWETNNIIDEE